MAISMSRTPFRPENTQPVALSLSLSMCIVLGKYICTKVWPLGFMTSYNPSEYRDLCNTHSLRRFEAEEPVSRLLHTGVDDDIIAIFRELARSILWCKNFLPNYRCHKVLFSEDSIQKTRQIMDPRLPLLDAPSFDRATAFFSRSDSRGWGRGLPSIVSPMRSSTTDRASRFGSRGRFGLLAREGMV